MVRVFDPSGQFVGYFDRKEGACFGHVQDGELAFTRLYRLDNRLWVLYRYRHAPKEEEGTLLGNEAAQEWLQQHHIVGEPTQPLNLSRWTREGTRTDWTVTIAGFWFGGALHPLGGVNLKLLAAFLEAPGMRLSNAQIVQACTDPESVVREAKAYVCDLNRKLCGLLHLSAKRIRRTGKGIYQFALPVRQGT
jgi:hypothetical protein